MSLCIPAQALSLDSGDAFDVKNLTEQARDDPSTSHLCVADNQQMLESPNFKNIA